MSQPLVPGPGPASGAAQDPRSLRHNALLFPGHSFTLAASLAQAPAPLRPAPASRTIACRLRGRPRLRPGTKEFP